MTDDHGHDHPHGSELSEAQLRVRALESILTEKGYIDPAALDLIVEAFETMDAKIPVVAGSIRLKRSRTSEGSVSANRLRPLPGRRSRWSAATP